MAKNVSYAIAAVVGSLAPRRFFIGLADRNKITFESATAHSLNVGRSCVILFNETKGPYKLKYNVDSK